MQKKEVTLKSLKDNGQEIPRMILVGRSHSGKTTLCQYLTNQELHYHKTQTVQFINHCILDTPGEYLEQKGYYGALSVTAADAHVIVLVQDATEDGTMFAPSFGMMFGGKPIVGIITKSDAASKEQIQQAADHLIRAGAKTCFVTSSVKGVGFEPFLKYIKNKVKEGHSL
ncbi:EutP/PduV family microcompartment system protein [Sinanaerobacter sp. ZZT-01]|uniref:EutP/PduV family microcompartment system protein n=1 Tax=Sinanaerobacter sp. ZZT-01 TaxID=3111540 RepID=UPI002D775537|nr:EutP/PduV family microcompartment system protein [Sinanaerobacter sp. ZZT-01]WRR92064.1 EutP/PduV family microcompartment system protein [Sinanaerobacter sp. ZZT-01]